MSLLALGKFTVFKTFSKHVFWGHINLLPLNYLKRFAAAKKRAARSIIADAK